MDKYSVTSSPSEQEKRVISKSCEEQRLSQVRASVHTAGIYLGYFLELKPLCKSHNYGHCRVCFYFLNARSLFPCIHSKGKQDFCVLKTAKLRQSHGSRS